MSEVARGRPIGRMLLSVGLALAGCAALAITASMNVHFGSGLAATQAGSLLQGSAALVVDACVALFALAAGAMLARRRRAMAGMAFALALAFGGYSLISVVGYGATERIAKAEREAAQAVAQADAVRATNEARVSAKNDLMAWLKETTAQAEGRTERLRLVDETAKAATLDIKIEPVPVAMVAPDMQAKVIADYTGLTAAQVQIGMIAFLALLLVTAKIATFTFSSAVWPVSESPPANLATEAKPAEPPIEAARPKLELVKPEPPAPVDLSTRRVKAEVESFFREATTRNPRATVVKADTVYGWYQDWARNVGIEPMTHAQFGRLSTEVQGVVKRNNGRHVVYQGIQRAMPAFKVAA